MIRCTAALLALLVALAVGCGKYGPPVRASAEKPPERKPSFEVPLPGAPSQPAPEPEAPAAPPVEEEPPPEGSP